MYRGTGEYEKDDGVCECSYRIWIEAQGPIWISALQYYIMKNWVECWPMPTFLSWAELRVISLWSHFVLHVSCTNTSWKWISFQEHIHPSQIPIGVIFCLYFRHQKVSQSHSLIFLHVTLSGLQKFFFFDYVRYVVYVQIRLLFCQHFSDYLYE